MFVGLAQPVSDSWQKAGFMKLMFLSLLCCCLYLFMSVLLSGWKQKKKFLVSKSHLSHWLQTQLLFFFSTSRHEEFTVYFLGFEQKDVQRRVSECNEDSRVYAEQEERSWHIFQLVRLFVVGCSKHPSISFLLLQFVLNCFIFLGIY